MEDKKPDLKNLTGGLFDDSESDDDSSHTDVQQQYVHQKGQDDSDLEEDKGDLEIETIQRK